MMISAGWGLFPVYRLVLDAKPDRVMLWLAENSRACSRDSQPVTVSMSRQSHFASSARGFSCFCFISGHRIFVTTPHYFDLSSYPEMLESNFFSAKNFNIFYDFGREKNPTSAIRSPIKPRKFPIKPRKFPIKHLENPRCFVLHPLYWAKKEEKVPCLGLSPLR